MCGFVLTDPEEDDDRICASRPGAGVSPTG